MSLDPQLREMVTCPAPDHGSLTYDTLQETLTCVSCGRVFPVKDGLPVLLLDEAAPGETSLGETSLDETSLGETSLRESSLGEAAPGETSLGEAAPGETSLDEAAPGETSPGETSLGGKTGEAK